MEKNQFMQSGFEMRMTIYGDVKPEGENCLPLHGKAEMELAFKVQK